MSSLTVCPVPATTNNARLPVKSMVFVDGAPLTKLICTDRSLGLIRTSGGKPTKASTAPTVALSEVQRTPSRFCPGLATNSARPKSTSLTERPRAAALVSPASIVPLPFWSIQYGPPTPEKADKSVPPTVSISVSTTWPSAKVTVLLARSKPRLPLASKKPPIDKWPAPLARNSCPALPAMSKAILVPVPVSTSRSLP